MKQLFKDKIPPLIIGLVITIVMGFWLFTHPTSVRGAPILGISFIVVFGFLLFLVLEAVRAYLKENK